MRPSWWDASNASTATSRRSSDPALGYGVVRLKPQAPGRHEEMVMGDKTPKRPPKPKKPKQPTT